MTHGVDKYYFPPTRFFGSKRRLTPWLHECLKCYNVQSALDVFGGTGTVSMLLAQMGMAVTYCDGLESNRVCVRALTGRPGDVVDEEGLRSILGRVSPRCGFVSSTFGGIYYTDEENQWIDGFIDVMNATSDDSLLHIIQYCFFQACLQKRPFNMFHRANLSLRNRDVARSFGNHSTWQRPFSESMILALDAVDRSRRVVSQKIHVSDCSSPSSFSSGYDLVYIDPPYLKANKSVDSYVDRYHFIEGILLKDGWNEKIDFNTRNRRLRPGYFSEPWEDSRQFPSLLAEFLDKHRHSVVALSYAEDRVPSIREIRRMFLSIFRSVQTHKYRTTHALSSSGVDEFLIIGEP
ncbi:DNA adenine methylase [Stenotrophomonas sp. AR026]|uniref:DNA adenine methylase n=1 Tax=Stenotrophomonas sp. AR026 TaxID=3398462 RepID=UPI003BAF0AFD